MAQPSENYRHIVRVANTDLDGKKKLHHALLKIKGVGVMYANMACTLAGVDPYKRAGELNDKDVEKLEAALLKPTEQGAPHWLFNRRKDPEDGTHKHLLGADLQFHKQGDIRLLKKIKAYRGIRHQLGLPVRGQRTRSNFRKNKGKAMGVKRSKT